MTEALRPFDTGATAADQQPKFRQPPLEEVVCGFYFPALPDLTAVTIGAYWLERRDQFPKQTVQPAIDTSPFVLAGPGVPHNVRCWLTSAEEDYLLQIQSDRFYLNWRKKSSEYPRFNAIWGRFESELERFGAYCERALGARPQPERFELAKIDVLHRGVHWSDFEDLATLLPFMNRLPRTEPTKVSTVVVRLSEDVAEGDLTTLLQLQKVAGAANKSVVRIETSLVGRLSGNPHETMQRANRMINGAFFALVSPEEFRRFDGAIA